MNKTTEQPAPTAVQLAEQRFGKEKLDQLSKEFNGRKLCIIAVEDKIAVLKPLREQFVGNIKNAVVACGLCRLLETVRLVAPKGDTARTLDVAGLYVNGVLPCAVLFLFFDGFLEFPCGDTDDDTVCDFDLGVMPSIFA